MTEPRDDRGENPADEPTIESPGWSAPDAFTLPGDSGRVAVGDQIGPFRVLHEIGQGGMGVVYVAIREDESIKRRVAIKLLKRGMDTEDLLRRFSLERQMLAGLSHPGIARLFNAGETQDGRPYFVMEYIEGQSLEVYCDRNRLSVPERLEIFRKVCAAVHHAHQNLIVHRDLKPGNILVDREGQPKLLDFGIAKLMNPDMMGVPAAMTAPELRVMTPEYASPEQISGEPISTASDVYSLGVILYKLVCGHQPYQLRSRAREDMMRVICEKVPERPSTAVSRVEEIESSPGSQAESISPESVSHSRESRPDRLRRALSGDIDNIVLKAMRKEPSRRYPSAAELAADIKRHMDGLPVTARPDTFGYRMSKFARRHREAVGGAIAVVLLLIASVVTTSMGWRAASTAADREAKARQAADQAREAETEQRALAEVARDRADRRFRQVRALARIFIHDFHDAIQELDGSLPARKLLVTTALDYLDSLAGEAGDDADLNRELADAYDRVGDYQGGVRNPNVGDTAGALRSYRRAIEIRRKLLAAAPSDQDIRGLVAVAHAKIGDILEHSGDVNGALEAHREELALRRTLREETPDDVMARRNIAVALVNVGDALIRTGARQEAIRRFEEALDVRRELVERAPGDTLLRRELAGTLLRLGNENARFGEFDAAWKALDEALRIRTAIAGENPESARARRDVATVEYFIGAQRVAADQPSEALPHLLHFRDECRERVEASPTNARAKRDLVVALVSLGDARVALGEWGEARALGVEARDIIAALSKADPENTQLRQLAAVADGLLAEVHAAAGDYDQALADARSSLVTYEALAHGDDADAGAQLSVARSLVALGRLLVRADRPSEALQPLEDARRRLAELRNRPPLTVELRKASTEGLHELALLYAKLDPRQAVRLLEEASTLCPDHDGARRGRIDADLTRFRGDDARAG